MTEQQIRSILQTDSRKGEHALFDTYYSYVYAIVFRRLGSHEDAEECVTDVFLEVFQRLPTIREGSLKSYMAAVARHRASNCARQLRQPPISLDDETVPEPQSPEDIPADTEQAEETKQLMSCIRSLGQPDAQIILQRYFYGRNAAEIARILGMKPAAVRARLSRALKRLRTMLDK